MKSRDGHGEEKEVIKEFRHEKTALNRFHFIPSITSITFSLITSNKGEGMKSHDGHGEQSEVIRVSRCRTKNALKTFNDRFVFLKCSLVSF